MNNIYEHSDEYHEESFDSDIRKVNIRQTKRHFIIASVLIVALLVFLPTVTVYLLTRAYDEQNRLETGKISNSIAQTVSTFMDGAYNLCYELADNPALLSMDPEVQTSILINCAERNSYMELLYVTGMDGMQVARSSGTLGDRSERWWFIQTVEDRLPFVSRSYFSVTTGMPCTAIFIPMYEDSEMIAVFGADLSLEYMQALVMQFANIEGGQYSFIIDGEGVVIGHHDNYILETLTNYKTLERTVPETFDNGHPVYNADGSVATIVESFSMPDDFNTIIAAVMSGVSGTEVITFNDSFHYASFVPIPMPGYSDSWSVVTIQNRASAMSVVTRLVMQEILVVAIILSIFTALIVSFFRSLSFTFDYLESAKAEADKANKSKSTFLATMSHEIRTPLNAIIGITQVQLQDTNLPQTYHDALETIYTSGNSLLMIINDILDLSKIETGKLDLNPEEYDVSSLINDTVQLNIVRIGSKKIEFVLDVDERVPSKVLGDGLRLKQILNNLISNAIKYTSEGHVKLTVRCNPDGDETVMLFQVEDTGQGISHDDQKMLFSEYTRFNAEDNTFTEGTGLGLAITKKLAEMMGGNITFESERGKGSTFSVTVVHKAIDCKPIGADVAERLRRFTFVDETHALSQIDYTQLSHGSVLVVDDVEINLQVAEAVLKPYDLSIELLGSGIAAIERIKSGKVYDIVFMDHMMPEMDGVAATEKLRELGYTGVIIALTANALVGNESMFHEHGFDGFLPKPIDIHVLDELLKKYIK
jgi:signal transduction histidine kinase